jgi:hypothetical protein
MTTPTPSPREVIAEWLGDPWCPAPDHALQESANLLEALRSRGYVVVPCKLSDEMMADMPLPVVGRISGNFPEGRDMIAAAMNVTRRMYEAMVRRASQSPASTEGGKG